MKMVVKMAWERLVQEQNEFMYVLRDIQLNLIIVLCFNHDLNKPSVKRHSLATRGNLNRRIMAKSI